MGGEHSRTSERNTKKTERVGAIKVADCGFVGSSIGGEHGKLSRRNFRNTGRFDAISAIACDFEGNSVGGDFSRLSEDALDPESNEVIWTGRDLHSPGQRPRS